MLQFGANVFTFVFIFIISTSLGTSTLRAEYIVNTFETNSRLFSVNPDTGSSKLIGLSGVNSLTDLASSSGNGSLFGSTFSSLYSINRTTAASTLIGSLGTTSSLVGLGFASNGVLFGVEQTSQGGFFSISLTTGAATRLFNTSFNYTGDIAYSSGNVFYATANSSDGSHLIRIDSGLSTAVDEGVIASGKLFSGLDFDQTGRLIAFASDGSVDVIPNFSSTGSGVFLSNSGIAVAGATFIPNPVPEPASVILICLGLTGIVAYASCKRQVAGL